MMHVKHAFRMLNRFRTILDVARERTSGTMGIKVRRLRCMRRASNGCGRTPVDTMWQPLLNGRESVTDAVVDAVVVVNADAE